MGKASVFSFVLFLIFTAATPAQEKFRAPEKAPEKTPPDKPSPPLRAFLSTLDPIEGKNLTDWAKDLTDPDPSVREKAITIIPAYGPAASSLVPELIKCLDLNSPMGMDLGPRTKAIMALGIMEISEHDKPHVVQALALRLEFDPQHAAKLQAAIALTRFSEEDGKPAIKALISGINDTGSWQIRRASILALRRIGCDRKQGPDPRATTALYLLLRDPAFDVRLEAIQALGYMDRPRTPELHKKVKERLEKLTEVNDISPANDKIIAMWAHVSLMAIDKITEEQIKHITRHLSPTEQLKVKYQALLCVGTIGVKAKACIPELIKLMDDPDLGIAVLSCWAVVSIGEKDPKAIEKMTELSEKKELNERVRADVKAALEILKNTKKPELVVPTDKPKDKPRP